jgi:hypothetical protein
MPAGKAIASVAMPTAVLMGMGFTASLAVADNNPSPATSSKLADEYKECVAALDEDGKDASATPSPSASRSAGEDGGGTSEDGGGTDETAGEVPTPSASPDPGSAGSSPDSGSDDKPQPSPSASSSGGATQPSGATATAAAAPSQTGGNLLESIGDALTGVLTGGRGGTAAPSPSATPAPSTSATASPSASGGAATAGSGASGAGRATGAVEDTAGAVTGAAGDTVRGAGDTVRGAGDEASGAAGKPTGAAGEATSSPSPSPSPSASTADPEDCEKATDAEGGVDNPIPVADEPWYLEASSLLLKGADYQGIVEVQTAGGTRKKALKYVISDGTDIGDLHQIVKDKQSGKTYHVQAGKGTTSTIRKGDTVMYTESISGNLFGLIPITFSPDSPPPLNIPLIYFTDVKVTQAAQFGGTLTVPGMHLYTTD